MESVVCKRSENKKRGELAEAKFIVEAMQRGYSISTPVGDSDPYDFILDNEGTLLKVQIKSTVMAGGENDDQHSVKFGKGRPKKPYESHEVDVLALYVHPKDSWYLIPTEAIDGISVTINTSKAEESYNKYLENWDLKTT